MSSTIFLLTTNKAEVSKVRDFLSSDYEVYTVTKTNLMVELYKKEPVV